jgi:hypothetical protein
MAWAQGNHRGFVSDVEGLLHDMGRASVAGDNGSNLIPGVGHTPPLPLPPAPLSRLPHHTEYGKPPPPSYNRIRPADVIMSDYRVSPEHRKAAPAEAVQGQVRESLL